MTRNAQQIEMWNGRSGDRWAKNHAETDRAFGSFGVRAMELLAIQPGERVMDVACGAGSTVLELAGAVGGTGSVLGLDVSAPLLDLARQRSQGLSKVELVCADASTYRAEAGFDALYSRFGAMFFDDALGAFANLRKALKPGGRFAFSCWQAHELNAWCSELLEAVGPLLAEPPPELGPGQPGTFSLADREHLQGLLTQARFQGVQIEDVRAPVPIGAGGVPAAVEFALRVGPVASLTERQTPEVQARIRGRLTGLFEQHCVRGSVTLPGAAWIVTAHN
jgi:SAM-dependent methyltransferase